MSRVGTRHSALGNRQGFALLAVLWVLVGIAALALAVTLAAREGVAASQNRVSLTRAAWRAEGCMEIVRAVAGDVLAPAASGTPGSDGMSGAVWIDLDRVVGTHRYMARAQCEVALRPTGDAVDVNSADSEQLRALFLALGLEPGRADSLADALLDWRDHDDVPRPGGAEREWYLALGAELPRNGPIADVRELSLRVRGFRDLASALALDSVLTTEPGRVVLDRAPLPVIASLPGMSSEAVSRITELRSRGQSVGDVMALGARLSQQARDALYARYADLGRLTTGEPEAWVVTSRSRDVAAPIEAVVEARLVRAGARAAVVRRRTWP